MSLNQIKEFLGETIGLDPETVGSSIVDNAIKKHMKTLDINEPLAYLSIIKSSPIKTKELIELVVVNETWFFRQPEAFNYLRTIVNNKRKELTTRNRLRILCLGCSTGEEPYSMAMLLKDMGVEPKSFLIDAVDISEQALEKARAGIYGVSSFDDKDDLSFRQYHFKKKGKDFELQKDIRDCVSLIHGNILHHTCPLNSQSYDIIFCRHVTIYLCDTARETLLKRLTKLLADDGTIFVGASETSILRNNGYSACKAPSAFAFERKSSTSTPDIIPLPSENKPVAPEKPAVRKAAMGTISKIWLEDSKDEKKEETPEVIPEYCWLINGISGDRSCQKLKEYIRCHNCPIRIKHGRKFLERESPDDYLNEWKENLAKQEEVPDPSKREHTVIFRLRDELFGIPSLMVKDISRIPPIHSIPYRSNKVLLGIANFSGELRLCVSVGPVLGSEDSDKSADKDQSSQRHIYERMLTLEDGGETWSFPVDEIVELQNVFESDVQQPTEKDSAAYSRGITTIKDKQVRILDHRLLIESLRRGIQ